MAQNFSEWLRKKIVKMMGGIVADNGDGDRLLFVNDVERVKQMKLLEYNIWYEGDSDKLLNFYTRSMLFEYNFEPFYDRNKRNYFWAISSVEAQIKRTHSGLPRDIVDTLVSIMPFPIIRGGVEGDKEKTEKIIRDIIRENELDLVYRTEQMPLALVEGWGCYKIIWDDTMSDNPIIQYYRAKDVDFIYKNKRITGVVFKDFYECKGKRYLLVETRRIDRRVDEDDGRLKDCMVMEHELFAAPEGDEYIVPVEFSEVPELEHIDPCVIVWGTKMLFSVPVIFFKNTDQTLGLHGRSIFTGKMDLFDDLDQDLSQSSAGVKLSTPIEYFNTEYLERDRNGLPKRPSSYDRKYIQYEGQRDAEGNPTGEPIIVTQPKLDTTQYSEHALSTMLQIMNGIMSPATLGIDIAKKDNAEAQREKEKVTIFTRNTLIEREEQILRELINQALCLRELMLEQKITVKDYDIGIKYSEFADASYENKLETLSKAYKDECISTDMYMQKLYGNSLNDEEWDREHEWLTEHHEARAAAINEGMSGIAGTGENLVESVTGETNE